MRSVTYSMSVSLDGYIVGPDGTFDWPGFDEEIFRFWIDKTREVGVHLLGRRLYETMLYWETADQDPSLDDAQLEWAALWKPLPKVVFSTTLSAVQGTAATSCSASRFVHPALSVYGPDTQSANREGGQALLAIAHALQRVRPPSVVSPCTHRGALRAVRDGLGPRIKFGSWVGMLATHHGRPVPQPLAEPTKVG